MSRFFVLLFAAAVVACTAPQQAMAGPEAVRRVGFLAREAVQHPVVPGDLDKPQGQFYFDLGDKPGASKGQIVVVHPAGMKVPGKFNRKIELRGTVGHFSLNGRKRTKGEYSNEVLTLRSWRYLD